MITAPARGESGGRLAGASACLLGVNLSGVLLVTHARCLLGELQDMIGEYVDFEWLREPVLRAELAADAVASE